MRKISSVILSITFFSLTAFALSGCGSETEKQTAEVQKKAQAYPQDMPKGQLPTQIRPTHYDLSLKIIPSAPQFEGEVVIDLNFDVSSDFMWLHGQDFEVSTASLTLENGENITASYEQVDKSGIARLTFDKAVPVGKAVLNMAYKGRISDALEGIYRVKDGGIDYTYTQFEAIAARLAFPGFDEPVFKVTFDVSLTVPADHEALANTPEISRKDLGDGFKQIKFDTTKPLPTYLVAFAVGPFDIVEWDDIAVSEVRERPIKLRGIATKGKGERLAYALDNTKDILGALEDYFQISYPYQKLDILAVPDFAYGAMENAGAITYREQLLLLDENSSLGAKRSYMGVHAHELAHQWFGNLVTPNWWNDIWLNEAFATWMSYTAMDNLKPEHKFRQSLQRSALYAMRQDSLVNARQIRQPILSNDDIVTAFDGITYSKGGGVLSMFEAYVGPEQFRAGIKNYMEKFAFKNASSDDFITAIGEKSDNISVDVIRAAFNSMLEQPGIPYLDIKIHEREEDTRLEISQSRYFPLGSEGDKNKSWMVPACFSYGIKGVAHEYCTLLDQKNMTVTLPEKGKVDYVMPNAKGNGYYRFALSSEEWSRLFSHQSQLGAKDMLALTDSFKAAMMAGKLDFATLVDVAPSLISSPSIRVVTALMDPFERMYGNVAENDGERDQLAAIYRSLYGPKLAEIGFEAQDGDSIDTVNLRDSLVDHLALTAQDSQVRAALVQMARTYTGYEGDGKIHADLVDNNLIRTALVVGVEDMGAAFARHAFDLFRKSSDGTIRGHMIRAVSATDDAGVASDLRDLMLTEDVRANEVMAIMENQLENSKIEKEAWLWFQENFEGFKARIPSFAQGRIAHLMMDYCSLEKQAEVKDFFTPRIAEVAGGARSLAQSLEAIGLCHAMVEYHRPALKEFLAK